LPLIVRIAFSEFQKNDHCNDLDQPDHIEMEVKINGRKVDVKDAFCKTRTCFVLGLDKGVYTPGRGYTQYHAQPRWVCQRRMLSGCPTVACCAFCRTSLVENGHCDCEQARKLYHATLQFLKAITQKKTFSALEAEKRADFRAATERFRDAYQAVAARRAEAESAARAHDAAGQGHSDQSTGQSTGIAHVAQPSPSSPSAETE